MDKRYVYSFGLNQCDGDGSQKYLLGGKGANLADMVKLGLPVPPGFTISTRWKSVPPFPSSKKSWLPRA
jgi:pyruvate,orthophosphate dikinase